MHVRQPKTNKRPDGIKILLLGDGAVGKSSLILRYCEDKFDARHMVTMGVDFKHKMVTLNGERVRLQIWDTAGQERFRNITPTYYRSADGVVIVFDVNNPASFDSVNYWLASLEAHRGSHTKKVLVGNKIDLNKRKVPREAAEAVAAKFGISYFETSALENTGVDVIFMHLAHVLKCSGYARELEHTGQFALSPHDASNDKRKKACCGVETPKWVGKASGLLL